MILLDTHVLVWFREGNRSVGSASLESINRAIVRDGAWFSPVSLFEYALLLNRSRIRSKLTPPEWFSALQGMGFAECPLDTGIAIRAGEIFAALADPNDAFITATAIERNLQLVTADERILGWKGPLKRLDARH